MDLIFNEKGIQFTEGIHFVDNSDFALNHLYHVHFGTSYDCVYPYSVQRESISTFLLQRTTSGSINYTYRGKSFTAHEGQIVIISPEYAHHYWTPKNVSQDWFHFGGTSVGPYVEQIYQAQGAILDVEQSKQVHPYIDDIMKMLKDDTADEHLISIAVHKILGHLARSANLHKTNPAIQKVCDYLNAHYSEPIHVDALAEISCMSKYHFSRVFKSVTGESPHHYLVSIRLRASKELLANTSASIEAIGEACGFGSTSHFIQHFKKNTGLTPHVFRKTFH